MIQTEKNLSSIYDKTNNEKYIHAFDGECI